MGDARGLNRGLVGVILGGVLLAAGLVVAVGVTGFGDPETLPSGVIATVDGVEVTEVEWEVALYLATNAEAAQRYQLENPPSYFEAMPGMRDYIEASLALTGAHPPEVRAMGSLVSQKALEAEIERRGLPPPDEAEVQAQLEMQRQLFMGELPTGATEVDDFQGPSEADREWLLGMLEHMGGDRYFEEYLPILIRRGIASLPLVNEVMRVPQTWAEYTQELTNDSTLVLGEELRAQFTERDVRRYLEESAAIPQPGSS